MTYIRSLTAQWLWASIIVLVVQYFTGDGDGLICVKKNLWRYSVVYFWRYSVVYFYAKKVAIYHTYI